MSETGGDREVVVRIALAVIWLPIQIALSLVFATGGIFLLLVLGIALSPFIGLFFLVRWALRSRASGGAPGVVESSSDRPVGSPDPEHPLLDPASIGTGPDHTTEESG